MADPGASPDRGAVVITGASTGIGRATAIHLDSLGFRVFAGVRKEDDAESVRSEGSDRLTPVMIDVTDQPSIDGARDEVEQAVGDRGLAGLFNNAGIGLGGPIELLPVDEFRRQMEINLFGQIAVTQAFMPLLRAGRGRIVFTGSIGGRIAAPLMSPYNASKFALEALTDSLRIELQPWDIWVAILEPGMIATDIWDKGSTKVEELRSQLGDRGERLYGDAVNAFERDFIDVGAKQGIPPKAAAKAVEHALTARRPRTRYLVGRDAKMAARARGLLSDRVFDRMVTWNSKMPKRGARLGE